MSETAILPTLLAFATTIFGLSLLTQVLQEVWKHITSSKSTAYVKALTDFLGPYAGELLKPGSITDLQLRGPFQILRRRPSGHLQPMDRSDLVAALERTSAPWIRRALDALSLEAELQAKGPRPPSPALRELVLQLGSVEPGAPGYTTAKEVEAFLQAWLQSDWQTGTGDASALLLALRRRFLPLVTQVETHFGQFMKNFELAYRRRNLRQTFLIGLTMAVVFQLPANALYQAAAKVPIEEAIAAAERLQAIHAAEVARDTPVARTPEELRDLIADLNGELTRAGTPLDGAFAPREVLARFRTLNGGGSYFFWSVLTALLISFGAPFWNDLTGALLRLNRGQGPAKDDGTPAEERR